MKTSFRGNVGGFTLIELLVVVLIIGILSAVALPQYQKAVFKSRFAEAFTNLKTISEAVKLCEMENGKAEVGVKEICFDKENLAISVGKEEFGYFHTDKFQYGIDRGGLSDSSDVVANAYAKDYDVCVCIYDDGHFTVETEGNSGCYPGNYPNFDVSKALNLPVDENCACC